MSEKSIDVKLHRSCGWYLIFISAVVIITLIVVIVLVNVAESCMTNTFGTTMIVVLTAIGGLACGTILFAKKH